jgi:hypothetical protein
LRRSPSRKQAVEFCTDNLSDLANPLYFRGRCRIAARSIVFALSAAILPRRFEEQERCNTCC